MNSINLLIFIFLGCSLITKDTFLIKENFILKFTEASAIRENNILV